MRQSKLFEYPHEEDLGESSAGKRDGSADGGGASPLPQIVYKPKRREVPRVAVVSREEMERLRELRRKGIEHHKSRMNR